LRNVVKCGKYSRAQSSQILEAFVLRAEIATTFAWGENGSNVPHFTFRNQTLQFYSF
jgi:hypothetical protein